MPSARGPRVLVSLAGLAALWAGFGMAAAWYPAEYDWRYMTVSHLLTARDNPSGYLWASGGIVGCGVLGLIWTWLPGPSSAGHWLARAGILFMAGSAALPQRLPGLLNKSHELLTLAAFVALCLGVVLLAFGAIQVLLPRWSAGLRLVLASGAVSPVLIAGLTQAYVFYVLPGMPWVNLSWRARGVPVMLSFAFWEWATCAVLSAYWVFVSVVRPREDTAAL